MAGSRAAGAREPGQIREEAALSDTVRAPRISLAGANDRRARPGAGLEAGCTVHFCGREVNGRMPVATVFTVKGGKIVVHEWFTDRAVAAGRGD